MYETSACVWHIKNMILDFDWALFFQGDGSSPASSPELQGESTHQEKSRQLVSFVQKSTDRKDKKAPLPLKKKGYFYIQLKVYTFRSILVLKSPERWSFYDYFAQNIGHITITLFVRSEKGRGKVEESASRGSIGMISLYVYNITSILVMKMKWIMKWLNEKSRIIFNQENINWTCKGINHMQIVKVNGLVNYMYNPDSQRLV